MNPSINNFYEGEGGRRMCRQQLWLSTFILMTEKISWDPGNAVFGGFQLPCRFGALRPKIILYFSWESRRVIGLRWQCYSKESTPVYCLLCGVLSTPFILYINWLSTTFCQLYLAPFAGTQRVVVNNSNTMLMPLFYWSERSTIKGT